MHEVQIIPFFGRPSGRPMELHFEGAKNTRFPYLELGFLLGPENAVLEPLVQEIIDGTVSRDRLPILLYGPSGIGKTHLLKGLIETWRKNQTEDTLRRQAYYATCADFHRQFTEAIATRTTESFRKRYRQAKLVLLDDIEQLLGKQAPQTELRFLLDHCTGTIVFAAKKLPKHIKTGKPETLPTDLTVRILSGTSVPLELPGEAVRVRFLQGLASALRIPFTDALLHTAAKNITGTIPQIYAAVAQKFVESKSAKEPLELTFWEQFSRGSGIPGRSVSEQKADAAQSLTDIAKRTAAHFSVKLSDIKGPSRCQTIALARSVAVYLARLELRLTYREIGHFFGRRDSSTVRHLFDRVDSQQRTDLKLRDHLFQLGETQR